MAVMVKKQDVEQSSDRDAAVGAEQGLSVERTTEPYADSTSCTRKSPAGRVQQLGPGLPVGATFFLLFRGTATLCDSLQSDTAQPPYITFVPYVRPQ
jgi:hypothetical protein